MSEMIATTATVSEPAAPGQADDLARRVDRHVGVRIRQRRLELGLTQQELSCALDISYQQIQKYETGSNRVSAGKLFGIAQAMGVSPNYFFENLGEAPRPLVGTPSSEALTLARACTQLRDDQIRESLAALVKSLVDRQA